MMKAKMPKPIPTAKQNLSKNISSSIFKTLSNKFPREKEIDNIISKRIILINLTNLPVFA